MIEIQAQLITSKWVVRIHLNFTFVSYIKALIRLKNTLFKYLLSGCLSELVLAR